MYSRSNLNDFALANPLYAGASVAFYTVDANGNKTATLAILYQDLTSTVQAANPQTLDSEGKFSQPVYFEDAVIAVISGLSVPDHQTGTIRPGADVQMRVNQVTGYLEYSLDDGLTWDNTDLTLFKNRGSWATGTVYNLLDLASEGGRMYSCTVQHTAGANFTDDYNAGRWADIGIPDQVYRRITKTGADGVVSGGNTEFTLDYPYTPAINAMVVHINGIYCDFFTETDQTHVTINGTLDSTDSVEFRFATPIAINTIDAGNVTYLPNGTGAVQRNVKDKLDEVLSVKDKGAKGNDTDDDLAAINAAIASVGQSGGGIVIFPPGTFRISSRIIQPYSNVSLIGGPGVVIHNVNASAGDLRDGIQVGISDAVDGEGGNNANPTITYTDNCDVRGFAFKGCRAGVRMVRARNFAVEDIWADGVAAVAIGNDAADNCENFSVRNIFQTAWNIAPSGEAWYIVGVYSSKNFTIDGVYQLAGMTVPANASAIQLENSSQFSATNLHIDQKTATSNGITVTNCTDYTVDNFTVLNCKDGIVSFGATVPDQFGTIGSGNVIGCTTAIRAYTRQVKYQGIKTRQCTTDLALMTDAQSNMFDGCEFNPGGTAVVYEEIVGGNNGINLQKWRNCIGIMEGTADGYFGGQHPSFRAVSSTTTNDVTGDETPYTVICETEQFDSAGNYDPATGLFTAPIDGLYFFSGSVGIKDVATAGYTFGYLAVNTATLGDVIIGGLDGGRQSQLYGSTVIRMTRGQTAKLVVVAGGGTKNADIGPFLAQMYFSGYLVA